MHSRGFRWLGWGCIIAGALVALVVAATTHCSIATNGLSNGCHAQNTGFRVGYLLFFLGALITIIAFLLPTTQRTTGDRTSVRETTPQEAEGSKSDSPDADEVADRSR